jgi:hypothetical protein
LKRLAAVAAVSSATITASDVPMGISGPAVVSWSIELVFGRYLQVRAVRAAALAFRSPTSGERSRVPREARSRRDA